MKRNLLILLGVGALAVYLLSQDEPLKPVIPFYNFDEDIPHL